MSLVTPDNFFKEHRGFAEIKQELFGKYFDIWCHTQLSKCKDNPTQQAVFVDLMAGEEPGEETLQAHTFYRSVYKSLVVRPLLKGKVHTFYFDKKQQALESVKQSIATLPFDEEFPALPLALDNPEAKIQVSELIASGGRSLLFLDPFKGGYTQQLLLQGIDSEASELVMFLNPDAIAKAFAGKKISQPLSALLGEKHGNISSYFRKEKDKYRRCKYSLDVFQQALQAKGNATLLFQVNLPETEQPYQYLLFSSPDKQACKNFKEVILPYCTYQEDGVPVFVANEFQLTQIALFEEQPEFTLHNLVFRLTDQASVLKYKSIETVYELDGAGTNYCLANYIAAFEQLRKAGKIELLNPKTMQAIRQPTPTSLVKYKL